VSRYANRFTVMALIAIFKSTRKRLALLLVVVLVIAGGMGAASFHLVKLSKLVPKSAALTVSSPGASPMSTPQPTPSRTPPPTVQSDSPMPVGGPPGTRWVLSFAEEFNGTAADALNSGTWHTGWWGDGVLTRAVDSQETALYDRSLITVANGYAFMKAAPNTTNKSVAGVQKSNLGSQLVSDPSQATVGKMVGYGYVEARLQQPAGNGTEAVWPGWWLNGHTWPDDMEIDILEGNGTDNGNCYNIHYGVGDDTTNLNATDRCAAVKGATSGMHTYGADIRPDGVTFYYDGQAVGSYSGAVPPASRYLMVGISTAGTLTSEKTLQVDYVRAWNRAPY